MAPLAIPLPRPRPPTVFDQATQAYPILKGLGIGYAQSLNRSDGAKLEFWPSDEPGAPDFPRPASLPIGQPGVEVYSKDVRPIDIMGDVASHYLIEKDPVIKRAYDGFVRSLQPWQEQTLRSQYEHAKENEGERRDYETWKARSGLPAYFRGYAFQQWGPEAPQFYTPQQLQMFDSMMGYLMKDGGGEAMAQPPAKKGVTLNINGKRVKVDDSFLSLTPQQQEATVNEIAASMGQPEPAQPGPGVAQLQGKVADLPSQRPSLSDEVMSFGRGIIEGIPIAGPALADARRGLDANLAAMFQGGDAKTYQDQYKAADEALRAKTGGARAAGNITGAVAPLATLGLTGVGGKLLGTTGSLGSQLGFGAGSGALISGADTAARGGDLGDVAKNAAIGAGLGLVFPAAGAMLSKGAQRGAQTAATNAAIKNAPGAADLKSAASGMFQQLDQSGVQVTGRRFGGMVSDLVQRFVKLKANATLDPKAVAALKEVVQTAKDVQQAGGGITLSDLHTLRQIAQKSAQSAEGRDKMFSTQIINAIDDMIGGLKPADMIGGADPKQAANLMFDAISTWGRSRRVGVLEEAIYRAQNTASGLENGLRVEFRKLLQNPDTRKLFTAAERQAIEDVVRGNVVSNTMKLIGKFGFGSGNASNMLGGSIGSAFGASVGSALGPLGSLAGAAVAGGGASLARKASEKITEGAAERAAKVVATPNVPVVPPWAMPRGLLPPATLPVEVTQKRKPIEITVRGGNPALTY